MLILFVATSSDLYISYLSDIEIHQDSLRLFSTHPAELSSDEVLKAIQKLTRGCALKRKLHLSQEFFKASAFGLIIGSCEKIEGFDFSYTTLREANLESVVFKNTLMEGVNLSDSNLKDSTFQKVNLKSSVLNFSDLSKSNFQNSRLESVLIQHADLRGANFQGANLVGADLSDSDLRCANFSGANLRGALLSRAILDDANFTSATFVDTDFYGASLAGVDLAFAKFSKVKNLSEAQKALTRNYALTIQ